MEQPTAPAQAAGPDGPRRPARPVLRLATTPAGARVLRAAGARGLAHRVAAVELTVLVEEDSAAALRRLVDEEVDLALAAEVRATDGYVVRARTRRGPTAWWFLCSRPLVDAEAAIVLSALVRSASGQRAAFQASSPCSSGPRREFGRPS